MTSSVKPTKLYYLDTDLKYLKNVCLTDIFSSPEYQHQHFFYLFHFWSRKYMRLVLCLPWWSRLLSFSSTRAESFATANVRAANIRKVRSQWPYSDMAAKASKTIGLWDIREEPDGASKAICICPSLLVTNTAEIRWYHFGWNLDKYC